MSQKLKSIYDALDHGNYKNAVKLCSALLQKQPANALCKALQAVALERCGRRDEALRACSEAMLGTGIDDTVLNTCQVVYRRCRQGAATVQMYDAASTKEPENEDYAVALYLALVREGDFAKGQQVATRLYKRFGKTSYLSWVVVSILLQVEAGSATPQALGLAEMMLKKAPVATDAAQGETAALNRVQLYLLQLHLTTLRLQRKHEEALQLLETGQGLVRLPADIASLRLCLLVEAGQASTAAAEARAAVLKRTSDWAALQEYIHLAFHCRASTDALPQLDVELPGGEQLSVPDHGARFRTLPDVASLEDAESHRTDDEARNALLLLRHLQKNSGEKSIEVRLALLGELELRRMAFRESAALLPAGHEAHWRAAVAPSDLQVFVTAIEQYNSRFGHRSSSYFEMKPFLGLLSQAEVPSLLPSSSAEEDNLGASLSAWRLRRGFRRPADAASLDELWGDVRQLLQRWASFTEKDKDSAQTAHELLALAVATLVDVDRGQCRSRTADGEEGSATHLLDAVALSAAGLAANPHAFQLKALQVLLYRALGVPGPMLDRYHQLDIKNIQHESLSFMVLDVLGSAGCHEGFNELCQNIAQFHEDMDKDVGDALGLAFRSGVLHRVPEYLGALADAGSSALWGRAVIEMVHSELSQTQTWEAVAECLSRQSILVSAITSKPVGQWVLSNQDRSVLGSLHPLPCGLPQGGAVYPPPGKAPWPTVPLQASRCTACSSSAMVWRKQAAVPPPQRSGDCSAVEELLSAAAADAPSARLLLSAALLDALCALTLRDGPSEERLQTAREAASAALALAAGRGTAEGTDVPAALARLSAEGGTNHGAWSRVPSAFALQASAAALLAIDSAHTILRCTSAKESWEKAETQLTSLTEAVKALSDFLCPGSDASSTSTRGLQLGSPILPCIWAWLHHCCTVLIPVVLWCASALPKGGSGKKAKEGQESLHATRVGLKNLLAALQAGLGALQELLVSAQGADMSSTLQAPASDVFEKLPEMQVHRLQVRATILEGHKQHLQALKQSLGLRLALLKSRGAFKP